MCDHEDPLTAAMSIRTAANIEASERIWPPSPSVEAGEIGYQGECCVCGTKSPPIGTHLTLSEKRAWAENDGILCPEHVVMFKFDYQPAWTCLDFDNPRWPDIADRLHALRQWVGLER